MKAEADAIFQKFFDRRSSAKGSPEVDLERAVAVYVSRKHESWRKEMKNISAQI